MQLSIGYGKAELTPPMGVELSGYGYFLERRCVAVEDPLFARTLAIKTGEELFFLINCDLLGLAQWMVDSVRGALGEWFGVPPQNVMTLSVHTHTAPTTNCLSGCGELDKDYGSTVPQRLIASALRAVEDLLPVTELRAGRWPAVPIGYNRTGLADHDTTAKGVVICREGGRDIAIASYACHPVTWGRSNRVSADYCGAVVRQLEEMGYLGLFLNGVCGDIDPEINEYAWGSGTAQTLSLYADRILAGFEANTRERLAADPVRARLVDIEVPLMDWGREEVQAYAQSVLRANDNDEEAPAVIAARNWEANLLGQLERGGGRSEHIQVQILTLGDLVLIGYPYETYTRIGQSAVDTLPERLVLPLGNANRPLAYLAVREALGGDSYGAVGSCIAYGDRFPFSPDAPDTVMAAVAQALREMFPG